MEKSKVYFTSFKATGNENLLQKLHRLMKTAGFENIDFKDKYAAVKIHFGEYGNLAFIMYSDVIREREELSEQIRALEMLKKLAEIYGCDISKPAYNVLEATQAVYFAYLAAVKEQKGAAMSLGRTSTFLDIYAERDLAEETFTEKEIQESSVTKTSPCWIGFMVPGSMLMYGSNFCMVTLYPRAFKSLPREAAVIPLPRPDTTPPVTKMYFTAIAHSSFSMIFILSFFLL